MLDCGHGPVVDWPADAVFHPAAASAVAGCGVERGEVIVTSWEAPAPSMLISTSVRHGAGI